MKRDSYIFVYGTLMEGFYNYKKYLLGKVLSRKQARVKGDLYHLTKKGYPGLIPGSDYIYGELITIKEYQKIIIQLDKLEGYHGQNNPKNEYNRVLKDTEIIETGEIVKAYLYEYNCKGKEFMIKKNVYIPEGNWRKYLDKLGKIL